MSRSAEPEIWRYRRWVVVVSAVVVVVVIVGVMLLLRADSGSVVEWEDYPPGLHEQIEDAAEAGDCETLRTIRRETVAGESEQIERTGTGSETLIRYLDDELSAAGCRG